MPNTTLTGLGQADAMSITPTVLNFDPNVLLSYYQARQSVATANLTSTSSNSSNSAQSSTSATANDTPPWLGVTPSQQAEDAKVLNLTNFVDLTNVPINSGSTKDTKTEQDNQKLFALYSAINNLSYLSQMSQRDGMTSGQLAGFNTRFQAGLQQVESFVSNQTFNNFTLQATSSSASVTSKVGVPTPTYGYTGGTIVSDADISDAISGISASDNFTISVTKGGTTTNVPIDLSQIQGTLTIDNVVNYVNQQMAAGGFSTRFKRIMTEGTITDPTKAAYGIGISTSSAEQVTLSSASATPALYLAGVTGTTTGTSTTAADNQGRLVKLTDLTNPQGVFNATTAPTTGTTTAQSTVVDANGNVFVVGNATGNFGNQLNQGSQDVYLTKYDSAGNEQWSSLLGSAGSASAYSLAVDPTGGVVVAGSTNADLTTTAVANGNTDSFVAKYDTNGSQTWTTQIPTLSNNQANAVSVDTSGNIYIGGQVTGVIGAGQTNAGGNDSYVAKLDAKGAVVYEQQLGTSGNDSVSATAVNATGDLFVASVQNGEAILSKYTGGDATQAPAWQVDLGNLQNGGLISGLAVSGDQIYVSGSTQNAALDAGGTATIATASSGGSDAFVFSATDLGATATPNYVCYVGTAGTDKGGAVTVGADGTVYLAGTTTGTFSGQSRSVVGANNMFVTAMASDGSIDWTRQYGGADGQSSGQGIAIDASGSSVLDTLGLARGSITDNQSMVLASQTTLRTGDSFKVQIQGSAARTFTVTIGKGETLQSLVTKINAEFGSYGKSSITYGSSGESLKLQVSSGVTATLVAGPKNSDALARLGISAGTLTSASTNSSSTTSTSSSASQVYGLGLNSSMDISTVAGAKTASAKLQAVISAIRNTYQSTNTSASSSSTSTATTSSGAVPSYLQSQLSNYTAALNMLTYSSTSSSSTSTSNLFG